VLLGFIFLNIGINDINQRTGSAEQRHLPLKNGEVKSASSVQTKIIDTHHRRHDGIMHTNGSVIVAVIMTVYLQAMRQYEVVA
jgi:endonuclease IV